eukprot:gene28033-36916_t
MFLKQIATSYSSRKGSLPSLFQRSLANLVERPVLKPKYDNYIGGKFVPPIKGQYFDNVSPIDGKVFTTAARSCGLDIESALDAAHAALPTWSKTSATQRSLILNRIADKIEQNLDYLATIETLDNGKPIRESLAADLPLLFVPKRGQSLSWIPALFLYVSTSH